MPSYKFDVTASLSQAIPSVGDLMDSINSSLSQMGYSERVDARVSIASPIVTVNRELTEEEIEKMRAVIASQFQTTFPQYSIRVGEFTRQSGNVSQLAE